MPRRRQIFEGRAKILYEGPEPGTLVQYFKDEASGPSVKSKAVITGKGVLNNRISEYLMLRAGEMGVPTHFVRRLNMREQLVREGRDDPAGSGGAQLCRRFFRGGELSDERGHGAAAVHR